MKKLLSFLMVMMMIVSMSLLPVYADETGTEENMQPTKQSTGEQEHNHGSEDGQKDGKNENGGGSDVTKETKSTEGTNSGDKGKEGSDRGNGDEPDSSKSGNNDSKGNSTTLKTDRGMFKASGECNCETEGHNWTEWIMTQEAKCTEPGIKERACKCPYCNATEKQNTDPIDHQFDWSNPIVDLAPIDGFDGHQYWICTREGCDATVDEIIPYDESDYRNAEYEIVSGNGQKYVKGSGKALTFVVKQIEGSDKNTFTRFEGVYVDGWNELPNSNYSISKGSLVLELKPSYLEGLELGYHEMSIFFSPEADASGGFHIAEAEEAHTVSFDVNGHGVVPESQKVTHGEKAQKPSDPVEEGWVFQGWYEDIDGLLSTEPFDFDTPIMRDTRLVAKWTEEDTVPSDPIIDDTPEDQDDPNNNGDPGHNADPEGNKGKTPSKGGTPNTGDQAGTMVSMSLMALAAATILMIFSTFSRRKRFYDHIHL